MTIYTAIFSSYDELKEPAVITPGWKYICFTDQELKSEIWDIRKVPLREEGPQRTARYYKILFHRHIEDVKSIYVDGSFLINCNLDQWWQRHTPPMTCIKHPIRNCVYEEAKAVVKNKRSGTENIKTQMADYNFIGIPANGGVIQSGILMREKKTEVISLCEWWWQHLSIYSARDQLSFAAASHGKNVHNVIEWDYRRGKEFVFMGHKKNK